MIQKPGNLKFHDLILNESEDFIIINKPPGISTLDDRSSEINVLKLAREYQPESRVCHRLDKDTSGILVIAKSADFYKYFSMLLENREVVKLYHAVVEGSHELQEVEIDLPIYAASGKSRIDRRRGKPSVTLVSTIEKFRDYTILACMPFTGRTHQIRLHLSESGMPIVGDELYGGKDIYLSGIKRNFTIGKNKVETPLIGRFALHSAMISFTSPGQEQIKISAPYYKDFRVLLKQLEKNNL